MNNADQSDSDADMSLSTELVCFQTALNFNDNDGDDACCIICLGERRYLKLLPCGHFFCEACIQQIANRHTQCDDSSDVFPCPCCRASTPVPLRGASDFPFHIPSGRRERGGETGVGLTELVAGLGTVETPRFTGVLCQECNEERATLHCLQCHQTVCDFCRHRHRDAGHLLLVKASFCYDAGPRTATGECPTHQGLQVTHFCVPCSQLLCQLCVKACDTPHKLHDIITLERAAREAKGRLLEAKRNVQRCQRRLQVSHKDLEQQQQHQAHAVSLAENSVRQRAAQARAAIDRHEAETVATIHDKGDKLNNKIKVDIRALECKMAALTAIESHVQNVLDADVSTRVVQMEASARETILNSEYFIKYTYDLPAVAFNLQLQQIDMKVLTRATQACIGRVDVVMTQRRPLPVVEVLETHTLPADAKDSPQAVVSFLCPVGEGHVWLAWSADGGGMSLTLYKRDSKAVVKQEKVEEGVVLSRLDDYLVLAQLQGEDHLLCIAGDNVAYSNDHDGCFVLTNKGPVWASLYNDVSKVYLLTGVHSGLEVLQRGALRKAVCLYGMSRPVSMDVSQDKQWMVVLDDSQTLHLYRLTPNNVILVTRLKPGAALNQQLRDACFFRLGSQDVLLLADTSLDDVIVVDFKHGIQLLGSLTDSSGALRHPSFLEVDPFSGCLFVACQGRSIVVCGDTGVHLRQPSTDQTKKANAQRRNWAI